MPLIFSASKRSVRKQENKPLNVKNIFSPEQAPNKSSWLLQAPAANSCTLETRALYHHSLPGQDAKYL